LTAKRRARYWLTTAACAVLALGLTLVVRGALGSSSSDGVFIPELGITVPAEKAAAVRHTLPRSGAESRERAPIPAGSPDRIPAHLLGADTPVPVSPVLLQPTNGWLVSNGASLVAVYAGAAGEDESVGRFVIVRQNLVAGTQNTKLVDAGKVGSIFITEAPVGAAVETSALTGDLTFRARSGARGRLRLARDTVELQP
jgi:hypothetical protein